MTTIEDLAHSVEQQGQGQNPILNEAAARLRRAAKYLHERNVAQRDRKRLIQALKGVLSMHCTQDGCYRDKVEAMPKARAVLKALGE